MNTSEQNQLTELLNIKNNGILNYLCRIGNKEGVEFILNNANIDINKINDEIYSDPFTPLMDAVCNNNMDIVKLLLRHKYIDVHKKNEYNNTAIDYLLDTINNIKTKMYNYNKHIININKGIDQYDNGAVKSYCDGEMVLKDIPYYNNKLKKCTYKINELKEYLKLMN